jgi:hypothetical protein
MSEASENPRPRVMFWARKFGEPLRQTFQVDLEDDSGQFMDLLAQADQRVSGSNPSGSHSEGA